MENATKALLIAAAVLIAILLISLGVGVFNTASEQMGQADLTEYEVQKFNEKFLNYENKNTSGANVNALAQTVFTHNNAQPDASTCVELTGKVSIAPNPGLTSMPDRVNTGSRFSVKCEMDGTTGMINKITVGDPQ